MDVSWACLPETLPFSWTVLSPPSRDCGLTPSQLTEVQRGINGHAELYVIFRFVGQSLIVHLLLCLIANIALADYIGIRKLLHNFRINPQGTTTPTKPDLRFLQTVYVDAQSNSTSLNREFLDDFLYPLGMIARQPPPPKSSSATSAEEPPVNESSVSNSKVVRNDLGVIAFLSLMEHGGMIVCLRDPLEPPRGTDQFDIRKHYRKSTLPMPRRQSEANREANAAGSGTENPSQAPGPDQGTTNEKADVNVKGSLLSHPISSLSNGEYLLHRGALRSNRITILATGDEALKRKDEPGAILVSAFGYPLVDCK